MSLRKSPTRTPALLEACRRNAQKSTGPRTASGKAKSRLNALRSGTRSRLRRELYDALMYAPPGQVESLAGVLLTPEMASNPLLREVAEIMIQAERETAEHFHQKHVRIRDRAGEKCF